MDLEALSIMIANFACSSEAESFILQYLLKDLFLMVKRIVSYKIRKNLTSAIFNFC
jgi:hypothetical protein